MDEGYLGSGRRPQAGSRSTPQSEGRVASEEEQGGLRKGATLVHVCEGWRESGGGILSGLSGTQLNR